MSLELSHGAPSPEAEFTPELAEVRDRILADITEREDKGVAVDMDRLMKEFVVSNPEALQAYIDQLKADGYTLDF